MKKRLQFNVNMQVIKENILILISGWGIELFAVSVVVLYGTYTIIKKACQHKEVAFLKPGPMLTPKDTWGPRPDSGLPTVAQVNAAFEAGP